MRKQQLVTATGQAIIMGSLMLVTYFGFIAVQGLIHFLADYFSNMRVPVPSMGYNKLF